jgi:hypothetical protein
MSELRPPYRVEVTDRAADLPAAHVDSPTARAAASPRPSPAA